MLGCVDGVRWIFLLNDCSDFCRQNKCISLLSGQKHLVQYYKVNYGT